MEKKQEVLLFRPENSEYGYFATYYWASGDTLVAGRNSPWTLVSGDKLTPTSPIVLKLEGDGCAAAAEVDLAARGFSNQKMNI